MIAAALPYIRDGLAIFGALSLFGLAVLGLMAWHYHRADKRDDAQWSDWP